MSATAQPALSTLQPFDSRVLSAMLHRETVGADAVMRSFDRIDRSGPTSLIDEKFGRTLSMYNIDGLHSGQSSPRDTLIQGSSNSMLAMYSGTGKIFNINI